MPLWRSHRARWASMARRWWACGSRGSGSSRRRGCRARGAHSVHGASLHDGLHDGSHDATKSQEPNTPCMRGHHAIDYQTPFHLVSRGWSTIGARIRNEQSANVHVLVHSRGYQCGMATEIHRVRIRSSVREKQPNHRHVTSPGGDHQRRVPPGVSFVVWCNALVAQELFHHARVAPIARKSQCRVTVRLGDARIDSFVIEKQLHNITVAISCSNHKRRITVLIRYIWIQARVCEE